MSIGFPFLLYMSNTLHNSYRLNIFGYPGRVPAFGGNNLNPGLLDIRKAVEWTYTYIKFFGGNPENMILFGQSAGGQNVDYYSYAWATDPLVKGFISESGVATLSSSEDYVGGNWTYVADHFNCTGDEDQQLQCLQSVPWEDLIELSYSYNSTLNGGKELKFGPLSDNQTVFSNYQDLRRRGQYGKGVSSFALSTSYTYLILLGLLDRQHRE